MTEDNIIIKNMTVNDIEEILIIENLCFTIPWTYESFFNELELNKFAHYNIILFDNQVAGYIGFWQVLDEGHITNVAIHPKFRRIGLACKLIEHTLNFCRYMNITSLTLEVRQSNIPAQNLYRKYGFVEEGIRKQYYKDNNEDAIIMWNKGI
ncbi:MAG: ribosomal protein S18-alanine N-acetyltransferase [Deltaproteobacteria bacterium]